MADRIRYHLDEHVDPAVARALQRHRIDVTTTVAAGLRMADDEAQLAYARQDGRILVTHDSDFLRISARHPDHPGIVYCAQHARSVGEIVRTLILIHEVLTPMEMAGRVEFI